MGRSRVANPEGLWIGADHLPAPPALPQRANRSIRIDALDPGALVVSTAPLFAGFPAESMSVTLEAGTYVLFCNLQSFSGDKSHVGLGQRLVVTVD